MTRVHDDLNAWTQPRPKRVLENTLQFFSIKEVNRSNPWLMDLNSPYPEPSDAVTPISAYTGTHRPHFNCRNFLRDQALDNTFIQAKDRPGQDRVGSPACTTSPSTKCRWQLHWGKPIMPPTAWACGRGRFWGKRRDPTVDRCSTKGYIGNRELRLRPQQLNQP